MVGYHKGHAGLEAVELVFTEAFLTSHLRGKRANTRHNTSEKPFLKQIPLISS